MSCLDRPLQFSFLELHLQWLKLGDASLFLRDPFLHRIRWFKLELQPGFGSEFVQLCGAGLKTRLSHQSTFTLTDQHAANSSTACSCLSGFPKLTCKAVKQEQQVRQTWQRFIYFCSVRQSRTISLHNGLFSHWRHPLAPEHPKQGSAICAYVSYKEQWVVGQVQLCLPLNQEQYLRWIGGIWRDVFLFVALSSEPTGPFSPDPLSQAAFILHKAQIPQGKWDGAEFKRQLKSFMLRRIRNDFLNATLYVLPYCKDSANEFNVQFLA